MVVCDVLKTCQAMSRVDVNLPGQVSGGAVQFLVEEVAPAANGLTESQAGSGDVGPFEKADAAIVPDVEIQRDQATADGARYPQPALPNAQDIQDLGNAAHKVGVHH